MMMPCEALEWVREPSEGAKIHSFRPQIALYFPPGSAVPHQQARMYLDDREVTGECLKTGLFISYRPQRPLLRGQHHVRVELGEKASPKNYDWSFEILGSSLIQGCVFEVPPLTRAFDKVKVEVKGQTRCKGWVEIVGYPEQYPLKEKRGLYRGEFKVPAKLAGQSAAVEVFLEKDDQLDRQLCEGQLTIGALDLTLEWLQPAHESTVPRSFRAEGKALPGSTVELRVKTFFRDGVEFGKLPPDARHFLKVDSEGRFHFDYSFPPGLPRLAVTLVAVARDASGNQSQPAGLLLYQGNRSELPPIRT